MTYHPLSSHLEYPRSGCDCISCRYRRGEKMEFRAEGEPWQWELGYSARDLLDVHAPVAAPEPLIPETQHGPRDR